MRCAIAVVAALLLLGPQLLRAQEIVGTLREAMTGAPVPGAVVTIMRVADSVVTARSITNEHGRFRVAASTDSVRVTVLRIGKSPEVIGELRLRTGERRSLDVMLSSAAISLASLETRIDSRCVVRPAGATLVAQLYEQARTALLASRLHADSATIPATRALLRSERLNSQDRRVGQPIVTIAIDSTITLFESAPVDVLLTEGFRRVHADGAMTFRAPDAELLTSDRFVSSYCLRLVEGTDERSAWIGVGFRPAELRRGVAQVDGVLWLDRATTELRQIDYGYVGLEGMLARVHPGGLVAYTRLPDGVWFIHRWAIRMPRVANVTRKSPYSGQNSADLDYVTVDGTQITSGEVVELSRDGRAIYSVGGAEPVMSGTQRAVSVSERAILAADSLRRSMVKQIASFQESAACTEPTVATTFVSGVVHGLDGSPRTGVTVRATWTERLRSPGARTVWRVEERELFTLSGAGGRYVLCGVPEEAAVSVRIADSDIITIRPRKGAAATGVDFVVR